MSNALQRRLDQLEGQKREVLSDAAQLSAIDLRFRPEPGVWSALDVLDHLVKVEQSSLRTVRRHLPQGASISFRDRMGAWFINSIMLSPMRVKVPASASMVLPAAATDLAAIAASWSEVRMQLSDLLGSLQPEQFRIGVFRHPLSGWMTITDTLRFLSTHLQHHKYQLNRLKFAARAS